MYNEDEKALIFLSLFEKLSYAKIRKLVEMYSAPQEILKRLFVDEVQIKDIVGSYNYDKMVEYTGNFLDNYIDNLDNANIKCVTLVSKDYPTKLKVIDDAPFILFAKGNLDLLHKKALAVVGTRNPSAYGREVTEKFSKFVAQNDVVIVSGLASGVDKIAHESALMVKGKTIAVLGGGLNRIYPALNTNLADEIAKYGLILSEYCPSFSATRYSFPFRNRIISGLSNYILITEAGEKSGALYTNDYAKQQGKQVFCVPNAITNIRAIGTNKLLKNGEAIFITEPQDILNKFEIYEGIQEEPKQQVQQLSMTDKIILDVLEDGCQTFDNLFEITKLDIKTLNSCLTMLQIRGLIKKLPGNEFSL